MFDRRSRGADDGSGRGEYPVKGIDAELFPNLVEFLSLAKFSDESERELGTVRIMVDGGRLKACFNDNAESRYGFVSLDSLGGLSEQLEHALEQARVDWRVCREGGNHKKR
jgi:hypothetical protein